MLKQVHQIMDSYQQKIQQRDAELIDKAQQLDIKNRYRQQLTQNLKDSQQNSNAHVIFEIEKQNLAKADALFAVLKKYKWQKKNNMFMFYDDKAVKEFNALYKEILDLNKQMQQVASANQKAVENKLWPVLDGRPDYCHPLLNTGYWIEAVKSRQLFLFSG